MKTRTVFCLIVGLSVFRCRRQVLNLADGALRQELPLIAKPTQGGIAVANGRVTVVTSDGTMACFAGVQ